MESRRQEKLSRLLQKELGQIFLTQGQSMFGTTFISVSKVRISADLGYARVYLSFLNVKEPMQLLGEVKMRNKEIRTKLAAIIKNQVRKIPELEFFYDDTMDYVEKIDKLFEEIKKKDNPSGEEDK
ncbi:MAG: 30S ribosome-binding factor RbfA [Bacteroidia bacterium]